MPASCIEPLEGQLTVFVLPGLPGQGGKFCCLCVQPGRTQGVSQGFAMLLSSIAAPVFILWTIRRDG